MTKKLSLIGAFCVGMMFSGAAAHALTLSGSSFLKCPYPKTLVNGVCQSPIAIDLKWAGIGNADKTLTYFTVLLTPNLTDPKYPTRISWRNPAGNTGGTSSTNFWDFTLSPVSDIEPISPFITGKGKADSSTIFGDCDLCAAKDESGNFKYILPDEGKLWFLFDFGNACGSQDPEPSPPVDIHAYYVGIIDCIKLNLSETYAPNTGWWPYAVEIDNIDVDIAAFRDGVLAVTGDYNSCKINSQNEYICDTAFVNNNP